jgi:hypothetical protein
MPTRIAAICGLLAPTTYIAALLAGGVMWRDRYSNADESTRSLGADTASHSWIYNRIATNLTGILILAFALGSGVRCRRASSAAPARQWQIRARRKTS